MIHMAVVISKWGNMMWGTCKACTIFDAWLCLPNYHLGLLKDFSDFHLG